MEAASSVQRPMIWEFRCTQDFCFFLNLIFGHSGDLGGLEKQAAYETQLEVIYCPPKEEIGGMIK